jgi:hypothetical protein
VTFVHPVPTELIGVAVAQELLCAEDWDETKQANMTSKAAGTRANLFKIGFIG